MRTYNRGWKFDSARHGLAAKGVKTGRKSPNSCLFMSASKDESYQGWANHATWAVKLHWDNNESDYNYFTGQAREFLKEKRSVYDFAKFLEETYDEMFDSVIEGGATEPAKLMVRDVGNGHDVDWHEIAQAYYNEEIENKAYNKKVKK